MLGPKQQQQNCQAPAGETLLLCVEGRHGGQSNSVKTTNALYYSEGGMPAAEISLHLLT